VGSSHWLSDNYLAQFPSNALLFENAMDIMTMGEALIGIRSRSNTTNPIVGMSQAAQEWIRWSNIIIGPFLLGLIALTVFGLRRHRRKYLQLQYRIEQ